MGRRGGYLMASETPVDAERRERRKMTISAWSFGVLFAALFFRRRGR